ncbi:MAG: hypothetical protein QOD86_2319 [Miltoncostaeaceae bacterium]|jgi:hypothetical protein|nr:hypothetical protein [Miltoncostaeaceae bacterium]
MRPRLAVLLVMGLALGVVLVAVTPPGEAATNAVRNALFAKNAGAVNGIQASRTPRPNRLVPLNRRGKLPASVIPASARVPGPAGERGLQGPAGAQGPPGRSALAPLQPGERIHGVFAVQGQGPNLWTGVTFPIPAPTAVDSRHVVIAGNDVVDGAGCTGTAADPVSAPGYVCIYPTLSANTDTGFGWGAACACGDPTATGDGSRFGFLVQVNGVAATLLTSAGTWVYTAA